MKPDEFQKAYGKLVAAAWADEGIKQRLMESPKELLNEYGLPVPEGVEIRMIEDTAKIKHLILPEKPTNLSIEDVSEKEAAAVWINPEFTGL